MLAIYKKEVAAFSHSMMGYLCTAFMLLLSGIFFTAFNLQGGLSEFGYVLGNSTVVLLFLIPLITMRVLSEEQHKKTDQLLFTAPIKIPHIVLGKFFAVLTIFVLPLLILAVCPLIMTRYGDVALTQSYSCFVAFILMGASCISVGIFVSSLTDNQIIAAVTTFALLLFSYLIDGIRGLIGISALNSLIGFTLFLLGVGILIAIVTKNKLLSISLCGFAELVLIIMFLLKPALFEGTFSSFLGYFSLFQRYYAFVDGTFNLTHVIYYLCVTGIFLFFTIQSIHKRRGQQGLYTFAFSASILLIAIVSYLITLQLPSRYTKFDTSSVGLYSISRQTQQLVSSLTSEVTLALIATKGSEDQKLIRMLEAYEDLSSFIKISYIDPIVSPAFVSSYTTDKVSDNSVLAIGTTRSRVIRNTDLYPIQYDYDTGSSTTSFDAEGQLTSAIQYLTSDSLTKIYEISGHGEQRLSDSFRTAAAKEGITLSPLNLTAAGSLPADAHALFLHAPTSDITDLESQVLTNYLEQGGRMVLITGVSTRNTPKLNQVLSGYGVTALSGSVVEGDANQSIPSYPNFILPLLKENALTNPFIEDNKLILFPNAHAITETEEYRSTIQITPLLTSSSNSYLNTNQSSLVYQKGDLTGPFILGALIQENTPAKETRIAWFSSSNILLEDIDSMVGGSNTDLILNTIGFMTDRDNSITIRPKSTDAPLLRLTSAEATRLSIIFVLILPLLSIITGIIICVRRERRQ